MSTARDLSTRPAPRPDRTDRYGPDPDHVIDRWTPAGPPSALVVMLHGGFWRAGYDRRYTYAMCAAWAGEGYDVASVEYRRTGRPGGGTPGTFADVATALDTLCAAATVPVVVAGHSAGGHLAVWAGLRHALPPGAPGRLPAPPPLAGVVALAGVLDLRAALDLDLDGGAAAELLRGGGDIEAALDRADPVRLARSAPSPGPRTILLHGDADPLVPIALSRTYADASGAELRVLPGVGHFEPVDPLSTTWPHVLRAIADLRGGTPDNA